MCPEIPRAYVLLGNILNTDRVLGNTKSPLETIEKATQLAHKAIAMDASMAEGHTLLENLYVAKREYDKALAEGERAVALAPSGAQAHTFYAYNLARAGRPEEALPLVQKAMRLNPFGPPSTPQVLGEVLRDTGRFEEAVSAYKEALRRAPNYFFAHIGLAGTYSMMGREKDARAEAAEVLRINPKFSLDNYAKMLAYKDQSQADKVINALRKAGLK
jgi:adenylate cyclase